ncbi:MAG: ABC transporter ATP-binding protein [Chromatiales bacterium]|jgi:general nucleoside transport system ATP-binding protein|nr:ABC transporter ATP-binding protein [Chromatiales bacterium]
MSVPAVELRQISKRFGAVRANQQVSLTVASGSIHGIVGENGAGKSTLMSILYGYYQADEGDILIDGKVVNIRTPSSAIAHGIGMVHQHFMLVDTLSVLENVMLGAEGGVRLAPSKRHAARVLAGLARDYGLAVELDTIVADLSLGAQQRVEILKALYRSVDVLVLDEPTGVLTPQEADALFEVLAALRRRGVTVILITHKLREIMAITDAVSVMRAGRLVGTQSTNETTPADLAEQMVGRPVLLRLDKPESDPGRSVLEVNALQVLGATGRPAVKGVSFAVRSGEIVAIAGVAGNGQSELLEGLAGVTSILTGDYSVDGVTIDAVRRKDPAELRAMGVAHVPEDRQRRGLVSAFTAAESAILGYHNDSRWNGLLWMSGQAVREHCAQLMSDLDVRPGDPLASTGVLSGGNQQKLLMAREMQRNPKLLLVGQPTRGVDIGAIELIHQRLLTLRDAGVAILLVSVELEEVMSLADRILVMLDGQIVGEVAGADATEKGLGLMMTNAPDVRLSLSTPI